MSTTTLNLPYKRFVAQVSTGAPRSKSTWQALMAENLEALKACPWREAVDGPVALADHDFTRASHFSDACDAFKMTGNYDSSAMTEVAYAGMAAYRFKVPASALAEGAAVPVSSIALPLARDRFLKGGLRVACELTSRAAPSTDWNTVRGGESPAASAVLAQSAANLLAGTAGAETVSADLSSAASGNPSAYLWIYVSLEDYTDRWEMYSAREQRLYAIEGSGMLVGDAAEVTFAGAVTPDDGPAVLLEGGSSPTWLQPLPTVNVGAVAPVVTESDAGSPTPMAATMTISGTSGPVSFVATLSLYGDDPGNVSGSIVCTGPRHATSTSSQDGETVTEEGTMLGVTTGSGTSAKTYLHYISSIVGYRTAQSYSAFLHVYIELPTFEAADAARGLYTVTSADAKWFSYLGGDQSAHPNVTANTSTGGSAGAYMGTYGSVSDVVQLYDVPATTSEELVGEEYFDPSANLRLGDETVSKYGMAAAIGDFSHAVATFEQGDQPPDGELLGRLARMSRANVGGMLYLHPESGALADELDVLRPVPRFFRAETAPSDQTSCQPGLSVWYSRPDASTVASGIVQRDAPTWEGVVSDPAFLQLALLALRAPSAFASRIVLGNVGQAAVHNGFVLRFVAWRCPAEQWDGSNGFAMAAMASMPSVYRSDGPSEVSWSVDCTGALLRFGVRNMTAERVGVSQTVTGDIAATAQIAIPLVAPVGAGDVVLIAPEVLGFADGTGAASVHFGRQDDPSQGTPGWARYEHNLGWFPRVTGE